MGQRLGQVHEGRAIAQGAGLALHQLDVVLPVVGGVPRSNSRAWLATIASPPTTSTRMGYSRVLTVLPAHSHGTEYRLRPTTTRQVLVTRARRST